MNSIPGEIDKIGTVIGFLIDSDKFKLNMYNRLKRVRLKRGIDNNPIEERLRSGKVSMNPTMLYVPGATRENSDPRIHLLPGRHQDVADPHLYLL